MPIGRLVVKVGTTSLTTDSGEFRTDVAAALVRGIDSVRRSGVEVVLVVSGAIALGVRRLEIPRPSEASMLQALSALGQIELLGQLSTLFGAHDIRIGQILLAPQDFGDRRQYLHARSTLNALLSFNVVPVINENDAIANEEIRFGDNDRLAALAAHLVHADLLLLLTDLPGVYDADPRRVRGARLVERLEVDQIGTVQAEGSISGRGSGGMSSKLAAASIAARSGVTCLIASAETEAVIEDAVVGRPYPSTLIPALGVRESARRLWIAYATDPEGRLVIDEGAQRALRSGTASLLAVGVREVEGRFMSGASVEIVTANGEIFARGLSRLDSSAILGTHSIVVHRDDLALLTPVVADDASGPLR